MLTYFLNLLQSTPPEWVFIAILVVLLLCGLGFPLPEEIPLFITGYLVSIQSISLEAASFWTMLAILGGDSILYVIGYTFGQKLFHIKPFNTLLTRRRMKKVNVYVRKYGNRVVFIGRFLAGLRGPIFLSTGILRIPYRRFLFFDGLGALISVPLSIWLSSFFCTKFMGEIEYALARLKDTKQLVLIVLSIVFLIAFIIIYRSVKKRNNKNKKRKVPKIKTQKEST